ncbi:MAG: urease accessory UreF family protein [Alphaproteobacteria bacterium]|nr:urease accessory UreF family protein [Alphaproteobacteria bacterium]
MGTDGAVLLSLIWLASPALPVGGFSYSEGLEAAIEHGWVADEASCTIWLMDQLWLTQARGDLEVVAQAMAAWREGDADRLTLLAQWVHASRETAEMRLQTEQMGRSMKDWLRNLGQTSEVDLALLARLPPSYPMAQALALSMSHAPVEAALQACAFGWAENMVQAALKSVPLGQNSGQRVLARLVQDIPKAVEFAIGVSDEDRQCFSPMLAIASSRHETQYSRLFRS